MVDIVIPLGKSEINHLDLRYCLRSIEANVKNYRDVWIIGELPSWIQNVKNIPYSDADHPKWKEKNIKDKLTAASMNRQITDDFLMFNDDHFILSEIDATNYPYYNKGKIMDSVKGNIGPYRKTMHHTYNFCIRRGFPADNVDTHCPIIYNKEKFLQSFNNVDFLTPWGYGIKTIYCVVNRIKSEYMEDCKFRAKTKYDEVVSRSEGRHVISSYDGALEHGVGQYLDELFPNKSNFEI